MAGEAANPTKVRAPGPTRRGTSTPWHVSWETHLTPHDTSNAQPGAPGRGFVCGHCGRSVSRAASGTRHRNHCPHCLWSRHVDLGRGDRRSRCRKLMEPIAIWVRRNGEWSIVHRCTKCSAIRTNRIAGDDNELVLMSLAARPLAQPPFPLDGLMSETR